MTEERLLTTAQAMEMLGVPKNRTLFESQYLPRLTVLKRGQHKQSRVNFIYTEVQALVQETIKELAPQRPGPKPRHGGTRGKAAPDG